MKENKGITIIHALVSVLIFGVFSSIILNSTASNLKSIERQKSYQQAYVTVTNAANLFLDSIDGDIIQFDEIYDNNENIVVTTENWEYKEYGATYDENKTPDYSEVTLYNPLVNTEDLKEGDIPDYVALFEECYNNPNSPTGSDIIVTRSYLINANNGKDALTPVKVELIINHYNIIMNFSLKTNEKDNFYLWLKLPVDDQYVDVDGNLKLLDSETFTTKPRVINGNTYRNYDVNTYIITYNAGDAEMHKGVYVYGE